MNDLALFATLPASLSLRPRNFSNDLRAVKVLWQRELIRFFRDKPRIVTSLLQPTLYLVVLGTGMASMFASSADDLKLFLLPGVMIMAVLLTSFSCAGSLVLDREFGFMREMLVAPVRRSAILLGKCLGGATAGTFQGLVVLAVGACAGISLSLPLLFTLVGELIVVAFALTAIGLLVAVRVRSIQSFMALAQMLLMPLFFLSGGLFPVSGLPRWLTMLTQVNPLTYAVGPLQRTVLADAGHGFAALPAAITWFGWSVPAALELALIGMLGLGALQLTAWLLGRE